MTRTGRLGVLVLAGVLGLGMQAAVAGEQALGKPASANEKPQSKNQVTVPFTLDHNRMIVEVGLVRPDGTIRKARAWVDTGTEALIVTEPIARELGLDLSGFNAGGPKASHSVKTSSPAPEVRVGGLPLDVTGIATYVHRGALIMPGVPAEVHLGASALRHDHVVLDYPARRLTVARPGVLEPRGVAVPCRVNPTTGLFMISAKIDGEQVPLGLDNGSAGTWVSTVLTDSWLARHPDWRHVTGALGSANFWGRAFETNGTLMRLPGLQIGPMKVRGVALLGLGQKLFDWYSHKSAAPVSGILGANVLKRFRLEVDFANRMTYWEAGPETDDHDLDIVGITVGAEDDGGFSVAGVVAANGEPSVRGIEAGDRLVRIGKLDLEGATMGQVIGALRGRPGTARTLVVDRDGRRMTVHAKVMRFP